jgi:hypothetical protein
MQNHIAALSKRCVLGSIKSARVVTFCRLPQCQILVHRNRSLTLVQLCSMNGVNNFVIKNLFSGWKVFCFVLPCLFSLCYE